jgi:spectrin alpha
MAAREASLRADDVDGGDAGVESLIKKHEDFDRAINAQEEKISAVVQFADQLESNNHYDTPGIENRKNQVLNR